MFQPFIGDVSLVEVKIFKAGQSFQKFKISIHHIRTSKEERFQIGQFLEMFESIARDLSVA